MIDKQMLLRILAELPEASLMKAIAAIGGTGSGEGDAAKFDAIGGMSADKITGWSERKVPYDGGKDRPPMTSKDWAMPKNAQEMVPGGVLEGDDPFLATGGT